MTSPCLCGDPACGRCFPSGQFTLRFYRYGVEGHRKHQTLDDAIRDAFGCHDSGEAYFLDIVDDEGSLVLTHDQILSRFDGIEEGYGHGV